MFLTAILNDSRVNLNKIEFGMGNVFKLNNADIMKSIKNS